MINVKLKPGRYVVAVSGGVDSMVLLDVLNRQPDLVLLVAHVNHGIRDDSIEEEKLVARYCASQNIEFVSKRLKLKNTSEEQGRSMRYKFLRQCGRNFKADFIVTAHHQDDLIETAIINIMRGTNWRGLSPFVGSKDILRPFISYKKDDLISYARANNLTWREDSTNNDENYLRNYVRKTLVPLLDQKSDNWRQEFLQQIRNQQTKRNMIDEELATLLQKASKTSAFSRYWLIMLPQKIAYELLQHELRAKTGNSLQRKLTESILLFAKVAKPGKVILLGKKWRATATKTELLITQTN